MTFIGAVVVSAAPGVVPTDEEPRARVRSTSDCQLDVITTYPVDAGRQLQTGTACHCSKRKPAS